MGSELLKRFQVFDRSEIGKAERTQEGFLRVPAHLTRTGVFKYRRADGSVHRQLRHPDEVFRDESLATLTGKPVVIEHPNTGTGSDMVTPENARDLMRGFVLGAPKKDGEKVSSELMLTSKDAIDEVESGSRREVSCGYWCDLDETSGVWQGEAYDAIQRNIQYNHVALTKKGRAGPEIRVNLDSDNEESQRVFIMDLGDVSPGNQRGNEMEMVEVDLGGKKVKMPKEAADAVLAHMKSMEDASAQKMDALKKEMDGIRGAAKDKAPEELQKKMDSLQAQYDSLQAEHNKLKTQKPTMDSDAVEKRVKERMALYSTASKVLKADAYEGKSDRDIKISVIKAVNKDADIEGKTDTYIDVRFDIEAEKIKSNAAQFDSVGASFVAGSKEPKTDAEKARAKMVKDSQDAWKSSASEK